MIRPTKAKIQQQRETAEKLEQFLAAGGTIKTLPGFGMQPTELSYQYGISEAISEVRKRSKGKRTPDAQ